MYEMAMKQKENACSLKKRTYCDNMSANLLFYCCKTQLNCSYTQTTCQRFREAGYCAQQKPNKDTLIKSPIYIRRDINGKRLFKVILYEQPVNK